MPTLPVNQSIVDFLKSRKVQSDFPFRKRLFEQSGLSPKEDEFRGFEEENIGLMNFLTQRERDLGVGISPENVFDFIKVSQSSPAAGEGKDTTHVDSEMVNRLFGSALSEGEIASKALETVTGSTAFPLRKEAVEASKEQIQLQGQRKKEQLINTLASRGLFFSGKRTEGLKQVDADTLARELGIDRKFALLVAEGLDTAAQRVAKEAQKGNQEALRSLRALGFTINPLTNEIEPTFAAKKAVIGEERAGRRLELAEEAAARSEELAGREITTIGGRKVIVSKRTGNILTDLGPSEGEGGAFTDTQKNQGASTAEVSLEDFKRMNPEVQNFFINQAKSIETNKENIGLLINEGINPSDVEALISALDMPDEVRDTLVKSITRKQLEKVRLEPSFKFKREAGIGKATKTLEKLLEQ